ncbi:sister chromatid cohesion C-terminus-domain-containing protein [Sphaerosporella brunnea]|uniref:Sister chromatid cohesion protein n=1 Tax=Sphaerosporella brunnea TaxID=1250544 RepID=A0A5J5EZN4_9PEZI|nr:sister chromatid cohesion C-terminus-domain-containing protein [Sphaerosporella brunnea]
MNGSSRRQIPPVDVDDALQYTPLSSIVPFGPDMIPIPSISTASGSSLYHSDAEREHSRQALDLLNQRAQADPESKLVRKYLHDIMSQLPAATEYDFTRAPHSAMSVDNSDQVVAEMLRTAGAGKFAEMVIGKSNVSFLNKEIIGSAKNPRSSASAPNVMTPTPAPRLVAHPNHYTYGNALPAATPQGFQASPYPTPSNSHRAFQIEIPVTPAHRRLTPNPGGHPSQTSMSPSPSLGAKVVSAVVLKPSPHIDRSEYAKYEKLDQRLKQSKAFTEGTPSKNRKRRYDTSDDDDDGPIVVGVDQRAKADSSLSSLMHLIDSIFQAEDNLQADTSGKYAGYESSKFWLSGTTDPCLSTAIQAKLEFSIKKVISVKRFAQVPVDDLLRIQKLCENALKAEAENIMPPENPAESDVEDWLARVALVDNGLKTAKTVLRIMVGGREEKQLYSEDLLASVLLLVKNLIEGAFNPMIEMRSGGDQPGLFKSAFAQKKILGGLLHEVTNVLSIFSQMVANEEATESAINSALYMAAAIIFVENASNEKDSLFGIQRVELFRMAAMDILAKIFAKYPEQRSNIIFEQILANLEKLPVNRATARQFKLVEGGKNIQLVSALIMRLVQTGGTYQAKKKKRGLISDENGQLHLQEDITRYNEDDEDRSPDQTVTKLHHLYSPLLEDAQKTSSSIVSYLVQKAMNTTKTGDQPYRHLLDIFTEDFLAVLGSPEWPAAELLLRSLARSMCNIIDGEKQPVTAKTMALDMLGVMGSGICDLVVHLREGRRNRESGGDAQISDLIDKYLEIDGSGSNRAAAVSALEEDLLSWSGPFRIALEHLFEARTRDSMLQSACGYYLTLWSSRVCTLWDKVAEDDDDAAIEISQCASHLKQMTLHREWDDDLDLDAFTPSQMRQAYVLTVLNMPFCQFFEQLFNRLLRCMDDNQAQSRSKALKSITQLLSKDPTILNRTQVIPYVMKKGQDASPLVRDSAVDLLGKCIAIKPEIEGMVCKTIIERSVDTGVAVRKRSMKILKDIYLHTKKENLKVMIAEALVLRIKDNDLGVAEQAKKTFEEIWIAPFYSLIGDDETDDAPVDISPQLKLIANERVSVIVKIVQKDIILSALHDVIKSLLQQDNKNSSRNFRVCKTMVGSMFDDLLDQSDESAKAYRQSIMQTLTVFSKADPKLFTPEQLVLLQPYIENLTAEDLPLFRSVIVIYRHALHVLTSRQTKFLGDVQSSLLKNLTRLPSPELREVVCCLWTIAGILKDPSRLVRVTISCTINIQKTKGKPLVEQMEIKKVVRTLYILGLLGHFCDLEEHSSAFKASFPQWKGTLVSGLIVDTIIPFCASAIEPSVRKAAIESLGHVCQTSAPHFLKHEVLQIFDEIFKTQDKELMKLALSGIKGFLLLEESRSELANEEGGDKKGDHAAGRLTQAAYMNQNDGVSTSLAQRYLTDIISIALGSQDSYAFIAVEVIASILRQGLVHPKELVPALVALETSTAGAISQLAFREHKTLHAKHETIVERGYMDGVRECFLYQLNVVRDGAGASVEPYTAKLRPLYDIVKEGTRKVRKKLLDNIIRSIDFDPGKMNVDKKPTHLEYARFVIGNLAFLDYATTDEVFQAITTMEKVVAGTGVMVAHSIEQDIFFIKLDNDEVNTDRVIDPQRLKVLSTCAAILTMVWAARTYLRKAFGINENKIRDYKIGKIKMTDPTMNKSPGRNPNVNMQTVFEQIDSTACGLESQSDMLEQCRQFVEILSVDNEFKLAADGEEGDDYEFSRMGNSPEMFSDEDRPVPNTPKKKRKGSTDADKPATKRRKSQPTKKKK